jgi:tetratricopeptide (TPR) repeat protein
VTASARAPVLGAVLALAIAVRLVNVWVALCWPLAEYQLVWQEGDMATSWTWSGKILAGDVLGRDTPHQYTAWMRDWAPLETWERWWGGRTIFHQAPLWAYALAGMRLVAGDRFVGVALCQAALGVLNVALVYLLAARLFGGAVPAIAAAGAAVYGPFLFHETVVLRDVLGVTVSLLLLWWLAGCDDERPRRWLVAGMLFALAVLARETTLVFAPFIALVIARRFGVRALGSAGLAFAAGVAVGLAPLVARNLVVGAPPLALSTRAIEAVIHGNAVDSSGVGLTIPAATRSILEQSDGRLGTAIRLTLATYHGDWLRLVGNELFKLRAILSGYEAMDNVNWYYFADRSPLLRWSLRFSPVFALAVVGLWLDRAQARRHRVLWYFLLANVAGLMYGTIVGRYRLPAVAVLLVYAAVAVAWITQRLAARRWRDAAVAAVAAVAIGLMSTMLLRSTERRERYRADEFYLAAEVHYRHGRVEQAFDELRTGLDTAYTGPDQPTLTPGYQNLALTLVRVAHERGRDADAVAVLDRAAREHPADPTLHHVLALLYRDALGRADEAEEHFARERALRPE